MATYTIVVPCFNEARRLDTLAYRRFMLRHPDCRLLFVDDCSSDETLDVLTALSLTDEQCDFLSLSKNGGKAAAVRAGMLRAMATDSHFVGYWDADLATPLEAIPEFMELFAADPKLQLVCGARVNLLGRQVERQPLRHYLGRLFATLASHVLRLAIYDTQCGAKLFRNNEETRHLFAAPFRTHWVFDVEILARMWNYRQRHELPHPAEAIYEVPLKQWRDVGGSKVRPSDFVVAFGQLLDIQRHYRPAASAARWERAKATQLRSAVERREIGRDITQLPVPSSAAREQAPV